MELVSSGIESLDDMMGGGLLKGSVTLVAGNPGTGKTTFAAVFAYKGLSEGKRVLYMSLGEREEEFLAHFRRLGMDFGKYARDGSFTYLWFSPTKGYSKGVADILLEELTRRRVERFVLDSTNALLRDDNARPFFTNLVNFGLKPYGITSIFITELPYGARTIGHGFEEFLADAIILLRMEEYGNVSRRILELRKVRWTRVPLSRYEFVITRKGVRVFKPLATGLEKPIDPGRRLPTGVRRLDTALGGGIPANSAVLIRGGTGAGKTLLAAKIALATASRGRKPLFITFEEPRAQVEQLLTRLGGGGGDVKVVFIDPWSHTPGSLHACLEDLLGNEYDVVIMDGASSLGRAMGGDFPLLLRSIISLLKNMGATGFFTMVSGDQGLEPFFDTIIDVSLSEEGVVTRLVKARGVAGGWARQQAA